MKKAKITPSRVIILIFLIFWLIVCVIPLIWLIASSLKTNNAVFKNPWGLPTPLQWKNYATAWNFGYIGRATLNSLLVGSISLFCGLLFSSMAAYGIERMKWKLSKAAKSFFLVGMMIPIHCILIPLFVMFSYVKLTDTFAGIILPYIAFAFPSTVYILCGFFRSIPREMEEAACIDGSSILKTFFTVILPLSTPGLFTTGMFMFVGNWNELLVAKIFISNSDIATLPVTLTNFVSPYRTNYGPMLAAIVLALLPSVTVYSIFSNKIVAGLSAGALKS